ncbi:hypothetical protein KI387_036002, partial [Taxus chinensis]
GNHAFHENLLRHMTLMNIFDKDLMLKKDVFVAPCDAMIRDVQVGQTSSIWYGSFVRGYVNSITVGESNFGGKDLPTIIISKFIIAHGAMLHGCTIADEAFVGMGETLLDGVVLEINDVVSNGSFIFLVFL